MKGFSSSILFAFCASLACENLAFSGCIEEQAKLYRTRFVESHEFNWYILVDGKCIKKTKGIEELSTQFVNAFISHFNRTKFQLGLSCPTTEPAQSRSDIDVDTELYESIDTVQFSNLLATIEQQVKKQREAHLGQASDKVSTEISDELIENAVNAILFGPASLVKDATSKALSAKQSRLHLSEFLLSKGHQKRLMEAAQATASLTFNLASLALETGGIALIKTPLKLVTSLYKECKLENKTAVSGTATTVANTGISAVQNCVPVFSTFWSAMGDGKKVYKAIVPDLKSKGELATLFRVLNFITRQKRMKLVQDFKSIQSKPGFSDAEPSAKLAIISCFCDKLDFLNDYGSTLVEQYMSEIDRLK